MYTNVRIAMSFCERFVAPATFSHRRIANGKPHQVSKWYNLVIFTASVQEYADPVIDWLELERKYFSARYYRQHCTQRNGAYVKDLSVVEPDLSRVMIVDNSPVSYVFHEGLLTVAIKLGNTDHGPKIMQYL